MYTHRSKTRAKSQDQLEKEFWKRVHLFRFLFQITPHLKWAGVCNSLPMKDLKVGSDIDVFIVAEKGRLFTARLWITLLTSLSGVRRHGKKTHKRFCLSFFVEESFDDLEPIAIDEDIYLARWVKTLEPIAGDFSSYETFIQKNQEWIHPLLGTLTLNRSRYSTRKLWHKAIRLLLSLVTCPFEAKLKLWQLKRAKAKASQLNDTSGTIINEHQLKFHDKDKRVEIRDEWKKSNASSAS